MKLKLTRETHFHNGYVEWDLAREEGHNLQQLFGKYHFIFTSKKGKISMVQLKAFIDENGYWEILCVKGKLFEYTERFDTRQEAEKRIRELLE